MDRKDIDLYDALSGAFRVLRDSLNKRGIRTAVDCGNAPQEIRVRESQFHQMLVNLVKNSIEAIDEHAVLFGLQEAPRISIRACAVDGFLNLEVIDNGIGIENKDTRMLFTAGFTTKNRGAVSASIRPPTSSLRPVDESNRPVKARAMERPCA